MFRTTCLFVALHTASVFGDCLVLYRAQKDRRDLSEMLSVLSDSTAPIPEPHASKIKTRHPDETPEAMRAVLDLANRQGRLCPNAKPVSLAQFSKQYGQHREYYQRGQQIREALREAVLGVSDGVVFGTLYTALAASYNPAQRAGRTKPIPTSAKPTSRSPASSAQAPAPAPKKKGFLSWASAKLSSRKKKESPAPPALPAPDPVGGEPASDPIADEIAGGGDPTTFCKACYCSVTSDELIEMPGCYHRDFCVDCVGRAIAAKIEQDYYYPAVSCPSEDCHAPVPLELLNTLPEEKRQHLYCEYYRTILKQDYGWIDCQHKESTKDGVKACGFGFFNDGSDHQIHTCEICGHNTEHKIEQIEGARPCPICGDPTIKTYGVCNVIQCTNCNGWWNWRTGETGRDKSELLSKARTDGTLWEAGELEYQQKLKQAGQFREFANQNIVGGYQVSYRSGS